MKGWTRKRQTEFFGENHRRMDRTSRKKDVRNKLWTGKYIEDLNLHRYSIIM